jgi:hypothetical protein
VIPHLFWWLAGAGKLCSSLQCARNSHQRLGHRLHHQTAPQQQMSSRTNSRHSKSDEHPCKRLKMRVFEMQCRSEPGFAVAGAPPVPLLHKAAAVLHNSRLQQQAQ